MSPLGQVRWPGVLDELLAGIPRLPGEVALYLAPHPLLTPRHRVLAVAAVEAGQDRCVTAAGDVAGGWLYDAARAAYRVLAPPEHRGAFPAFRGWMQVDPKLPALPLLGLALAHAERTREPLILLAADLGPLVGGRTTRRSEVIVGGRHGVAALVELSQPSPQNWCHELAHVLDPLQRDPVASEAFADTLGALLLTRQPGSVAELDALTVRVDAEIRQTAPASTRQAQGVRAGRNYGSWTDDDELPAPGVDSLVAFAALDLHGWRPA